ncbi:MAG: hypothetical protein LUD84_09685 [Clostridiales bacterium]|nr:hypothetical protein [Clostridiales bacterium]
MTDNITPLAPQTRAPMTTKEIIDRLSQVSFTYSRLTADTFSAVEVARDKQALTAAVQAVEVLEEIKQDMHGYCVACKHKEKHTYEPPCADCASCYPSNDAVDHWEFRWPLGKEADHETR